MPANIFRNRSGRVIGIGRLLLAGAFLFAIFIDPSQPNQRPNVAYTLLIGYVLWAAVLLVLTWRDWWLENRAAGPGHLVDIAMFGMLVYFTEGYTSPFFTFFVFLLLSAAIRWSWREIALTAVLVLLLYIAAGTAALVAGESTFDLQRLLVRSTYLIVLSMLFVWFAVNQGEMPESEEAADATLADAKSLPIAQLLRIASTELRGSRALFVWSHKEEPWLHFAEFDGQTIREERTGPAGQAPFAGAPDERAFLVDGPRRRGLCRARPPGRGLELCRPTIDPDFAARFSIDQGLVIPVRASDYEGEMIVLGIEGMSGDDLVTADRLAARLAGLLDQASMIAISEEAAVARARLSLARDLHDSVVQVLAGAAFRLEALKSWAKSGRDLDGQIDAVKEDLAIEQRNLRAIIATLRSGQGSLRQTDLCAGLPPLADQLSRLWQIGCRLSLPDVPVQVPAWVEHELHQIVREAAANATRHGRATMLAVELGVEEGALAMTLADDGAGLPERGNGNGGGRERPWSVNERVRGLGGTLAVMSDSSGCRLDIKVPLGANEWLGAGE